MLSTCRVQYESPQLPKRVRLNDNTEVNEAVANVNKDGGMKSIETKKTKAQKSTKGSTRAGKIGKTARKLNLSRSGGEEPGKRQFREKCKQIAADAQPRGVRSRLAYNNVQPRTSRGKTSETEGQAEFMENEQLIRMTFDKDDSFYKSDSEDDKPAMDGQFSSDSEMNYEDNLSDHLDHAD